LKVIIPSRIPANVAGDPLPGLNQAATHAPVAEFYYPELVRGDGVPARPLLVWQQPWLSPVSIIEWPLLIDIDQTPFIAWDKRIAQ